MSSNKWKIPDAPPPPLFTNEKERDLVKQINSELLERVIGQNILYFPLDIQNSNYHSLYGESINKIYSAPIHVYVLVNYQGNTTITDSYGVDRIQNLEIFFHQRRLTEDQNLYVSEGDVVAFDGDFFEIVELNDPSLIFGNADYKMEIIAKCTKIREGVFNGE